MTSYSGRENLDAMEHARNYNSYLLSLIRRYLVGVKVLDFGAGTGTFARPMAAEGLQVLCVEADIQLNTQLRASGLNAVGSLELVPEQSVDTIYSLNVLEHIENDVKVLIELRRRLRRGGTLLLYVPAFMLLFSAMDRKVGHFRRYDRSDLVQRTREAGFEVVRAHYVDSLGFFASLIYKVIGNESGIVTPRQVLLYDRFLFPISKGLDTVLRRLVGKNLMLVARVPAN